MSAIRRISTVLFCVLVVASCQEDGAASDDSSTFPDLLKIQREACERDRGRWGLSANKVTYVCYRTLDDANQHCSKSSDCDGLCLARSQSCSPIEPFYGCHEVLSDSGFPQTLCIE